ncbi:metallophosphoesterase [uncultured Microbacterium sp.]|uniref:metallophosphoesterase family protein n=1 Tax=uncultured Microbacterium sp. TaxID=191216 RepID=UPI002628195F|nr:metallophosphoesterase [uncultured Microbacterium sp.]
MSVGASPKVGHQLKSLEYSRDIALSDERVAVCGDWHGNIGWVRMLARALPNLAYDVTTVLQLGDWWMGPQETDPLFAEAGIERVLVTLGNHEPWDRIRPLLAEYPGAAVRVSDVTWILPRPARLTIGGRTVLSFGGAASVDRLWRTEGRDWWPDEAITDEQVAAAIAGGPTDLMLTHESPATTPVGAVRELLGTNPNRFPTAALADSAQSRARVSEVWDAVRPELLMHGHMHTPGGGIAEDGRRVVSLGRDVQEDNLAFLDMSTLTLETPSLQEMRNAARRW